MTVPDPAHQQWQPAMEPVTPVQPELVPFGQPLPTLVQIADISCTATTVYTPSGEAPIGTVFWSVTDMCRQDTKIPAYAIVLAIIFSLACLIGLLFLLIKDTVITGYIQVAVQGPGLSHVTNVPANFGVMQDLTGRVNYARGLTQMAKNR